MAPSTAIAAARLFAVDCPSRVRTFLPTFAGDDGVPGAAGRPLKELRWLRRTKMYDGTIRRARAGSRANAQARQYVFSGIVSQAAGLSLGSAG
jgi:hypothetical protein